MRALWMPLALLGLLWIGVTCTQVPPPGESVAPAGEGVAPAGANELLATACERALARLAPDPAPAQPAPVAFPVEVGPALRALHGTGMGPRVVALEAAVERAARLALADVKPQLEQAVASFAPESPDALVSGSDDALSVAFRAAKEEELRAALRPAVEPRLAEAGALEALEGVRNGAGRLPLPREVDLDLVSLVTDQATRNFFIALADEERQLRKERVALRLQTGREVVQ